MLSPVARAFCVATALGAALGFGASSCSAPAPCSADTCSNGCCSPTGRCVSGDVVTQCGRLGLSCEDCGDGNTCTENRCIAPPAVLDGGAGGGGGGCTVGFKAVTGAALVGTPIALLGARNLALADLDGDGRIDAVAAFSGTGQGYLLHGLGDGTFVESKSVTTLASPVGVAVGRIDGDLRPDVVFLNQSAPSVVWLAQPDGGFVTVTTLAPTHSDAMGVCLADVDRDGHLDLITPVREITSGDVWVNLGVGDGTFGPATAVGTGQAVLFTDAADLDGDGRVDFASVRNGADQVGVVLHDSTGAFAAERVWGTGKSPLALALGLIDGDDRPDLVAVNQVSASLTLRPNNGNGTFPVAATRATTAKPATVAIGDVTGDSLADVVVGGDKLDVFPGLGGGNLGIPTVFPTPASSVAIADVDGNGLNDIVVLGPSRLTTYLRGCW